MHKAKYLFHNLFILLFISLFLQSCNYKEVQLKKIESFKVLNFDREGAEVELNLLVDNKNKFGFKTWVSVEGTTGAL
jgi:hypothetical protein